MLNTSAGKGNNFVPLNGSISDKRLPELLAPAGNWACAKAAIENGANAIYFGLERFNARMRAENFTEADLPELMAFLHRRGVKGYVTLNTLVFTRELSEAEHYIRSIIAAGVDAIIVQDIGICKLIRHLSADFPIHGSTQMTITSAVGVEFARSLGCELVVLARECSIKEINTIQRQLSDIGVNMPLEVFVHGALCVAYSGQCLTSEALGGRSANRGECAQACRMPYELISDGKKVDLGDRRYLLSPQDLSGLEVLPELVSAGVTCLKIEGRLKSPEYVASVTRIYREALDSIPIEYSPWNVSQGDRYTLEMAFSRGLYSGWFQGINNQKLVHAEFGKKRGVYLGNIHDVQSSSPQRGKSKANQVTRVLVDLKAPVKPGDGIVFDNGHPERREEGGRVYEVFKIGRYTALTFGKGTIDWNHVKPGNRLWKTSDPELDQKIRKSFQTSTPQQSDPITIDVHGSESQPMTIIARDTDGHVAQVESAMVLVAAHSKPLTDETLTAKLGRLGGTIFQLGSLHNQLVGEVMLPMSELNRLRRLLVNRLETIRSQPHYWQLHPSASYHDLMPLKSKDLNNANVAHPECQIPTLIVLVRTLAQLKTAVDLGVRSIYCELEDPRAYLPFVTEFRQRADQRQKIWVAPPRIIKPLENWILSQVRRCDADGYLIRNYDQLNFFKGDRCIGDFSLNVANPITAKYFMDTYPLERVTASYDLNIQQLEDLLALVPPEWVEITVHQHMPMFHMEHCVFCAFLSEGTDFTNCGRPCESHTVHLRDRVGTQHVLHADAGCRNTVFNGVAQTGAEYIQRLTALGTQYLRLEFLDEPPEQVSSTIQAYQKVLEGTMTGQELWRSLKLRNQLGVTRGPLEKRT